MPKKRLLSWRKTAAPGRSTPTRTNPRNRCLSSAELNVRIHSALRESHANLSPSRRLLTTAAAWRSRVKPDRGVPAHRARPLPSRHPQRHESAAERSHAVETRRHPAHGSNVGVTGKITFREPSAELRGRGLLSADSLLPAANEAVILAGYQLWVLLDRLDVAFADPGLPRRNQAN